MCVYAECSSQAVFRPSRVGLLSTLTGCWGGCWFWGGEDNYVCGSVITQTVNNKQLPYRTGFIYVVKSLRFHILNAKLCILFIPARMCMCVLCNT